MYKSKTGHFYFGWTRLNFWRVKAHGIQVVKLFYLGVGEFNLLKKLRGRFVRGVGFEEKDLDEAKKSLCSKNYHIISPIRDVLNLGIGNPASGYEAARMWNTRDSLFWGWRRVAEYFRDFFGKDHEREVYELMAN